MRVSVSKISELTGFDRRTINRRLTPMTPEVEGKAHLYDSAEALKLVYGVQQAAGETLDLTQERAALAKVQRQLTELKVGQQERRLVSVESVARDADRAARTVKQTLLAVPGRVCASLPVKNAREVEIQLTAEIKDALRAASVEISEAG